MHYNECQDASLKLPQIDVHHLNLLFVIKTGIKRDKIMLLEAEE